RYDSQVALGMAVMPVKPPSGRLAGVLAAVLIVLSFYLDWVLPRGVTVSIGYCGAVVLAAGVPLDGAILATAALGTLLTWISLWMELPDGNLLDSVFDRSMVTGVIWLTAIASMYRRRAQIQLTARAAELARANADLDRFAAIV